MIVILTKEERDLIGWGLMALYKDTFPADKQTTKKQMLDILKKINPYVKYHLRD